MQDPDEVGPRVGLLGELEVEIQLVERKWHPVRLDTAQMAANADLLAVNRQQRTFIQVKTTNAYKEHSHSKCLGFGYSTDYIQKKKSIFNSKNSPLIADVVIGVSYYPQKSRFVVMPVAFAETLCRLHCDYWHSRPEKTAAKKRSESFSIYLSFTADMKAHKEHHDRVKRNLQKFENAWNILSEPTDKLHDPKKWPLEH